MNSAACLLQDGEIVAAAQEERFTRKKHLTPEFPAHAIHRRLRPRAALGGVATLVWLAGLLPAPVGHYTVYFAGYASFVIIVSLAAFHWLENPARRGEAEA